MLERKKMSRKEEKVKDLYTFYLNYGFDHTIEEISDWMHIRRKTFYNRYISKENSIQQALQISHQQFVERFTEQRLHCNHSVEELVLFVWEFQRFAQQENVYFQYDMENRLFCSAEAPFKSIFESVVRKGLRCYHIKEDVDMETYVDYFFVTLSYYTLGGKLSGNILQYILCPLLNERGLELLGELNIENM